MIDQKASLKNSLWSITDNFSQQILSFLIFTILARWLSPQAFGLLAIAHILVQFVRLAVLDALTLPVLRAPQIDTRLFSWLFTQCVCIALFFAALMAVSAPAMAAYFDATELVPVLWGMSFVIVLHGLGRAHDALLLRQVRFRLLALRSLFSVGAGGAVAIVLAYRGHGALALVAQQITTVGIAFLMSLIAEWSFWRPRWVFSLQLLRSHARECGKASAAAMLTYANGNGDAALVSVVLGPHATGLYNLAKRVTTAISLMIAASLSRVAAAMFYRHGEDTDRLRQHFAYMSNLTAGGLMLIYGLLANLAEPVVRIVFGPQWLAAAPLLLILSISGLFQALFNIGQGLSLATRHGTRSVKLGLLQLISAVTLAIVLSSLELIGMALGFAIATVISACVMLALVNAQIHRGGFAVARDSAPPLLALLALTAAVQIGLTRFTADSWAALIGFNIVGGLAYVLIYAPLYYLGNRPGKAPESA